MSGTDRDIDELLRRNIERQLAGFAWDHQRQTVRQGLDPVPARKRPRIVTIGVAAALVLMTGFLCISFLQDRIPPTEDVVVHETTETDSLLASTDPTTILLTGPMQLRVSNDPALAPHSLWEQ